MTQRKPLMSYIADFTAGPPNTPGTSAVSLLNGPTALRTWGSSRGRQYELGTVEAGTLSTNLSDPSEYLNPANGSSPWNSGSNSLLPYRCTQLGAWWNPTTKDTTGNLLNNKNSATGLSANQYDPSFETSGSFVGVLSGSPIMTLSATQAFVGTKSLSVAVTALGDTGWILMPTAAGQTYTFSAYVFVPASHTVTVSFVNYPGAVGTTIGSAISSTTAAWQRLTMTGVAAGPRTAVTFKFASGTVPATFYMDAIQLELGSTASAWTATGPVFYPIYTGYVERYPQQWEDAGFRGSKALQCVDALSPLSRAIISQSYASTALADLPSIYIPYNDGALPQTAQRPTGGQPLVGYTTLGTNGSVNFSGDAFLDGSSAVSIVQQNSDPPITSSTGMNTYLGTRQGMVSVNTQAMTLEMWVKPTSGTNYFGAQVLLAGDTPDKYDGAQHGFGCYTSGGRLCWFYFDPNGFGSVLAPLSNSTGWIGYPDGQWHYLAFMLPGSDQWQTQTDTATGSVVSLGFSTTKFLGVSNIYGNATTAFGDPVTELAVANWAIYPTALTLAQRNAHYQRGIGYLGELSGARALRLLTKYWSSNVSADTGVTKMATDFALDGQSVLAALQGIATTEGGLIYADAAGKVIFESRETRYTSSATSLFTFGENAAAGELPYTAVEYDFDPTFVYSQANLTGGSGNQIAPVVNAASQAAYGQRILSQTLSMQSDWDVGQAAQFYVQRYAQPPGSRGSTAPPRISKLSLDPASNPDLFTAALSLDISDRITVKRRTSAGVTISGDYYVEQIQHASDGDASTWTVELQVSPVFNPSVWILGDATKGVLGSTTVCVY